jgi:hypothetical protein
MLTPILNDFYNLKNFIKTKKQKINFIDFVPVPVFYGGGCNIKAFIG